jgi:hypothetical protein
MSALSRPSTGPSERGNVPASIAAFRIRGLVGREPMAAEWSGGYLSADPELLERADQLVGAGTLLGVGGIPEPVPAGLDDALPAALTLLRCFDGITDVDVTTGDAEEDVVRWVTSASPVAIGSVRILPVRADAGNPA